MYVVQHVYWGVIVNFRLYLSLMKYKDKLELYNQAKVDKKNILVSAGNWVGFFSNKAIPNNVLPGYHHLLGRHGSLMYDIDNIMPIQNNTYHTEYHHRDIAYLLKQSWYVSFLEKCKEYHPNVYNIELKRMNKAGIIGDEVLLCLWI